MNIGDIGHMPGTLRFFEDYIEGAELSLWLQTETPAVREMLVRAFPRVRIVTGHLGSPEVREVMGRCEVFVQNSGMLYVRFWNARPDFLRALVERGTRFPIWGQSFDGFHTEDEEGVA